MTTQPIRSRWRNPPLPKNADERSDANGRHFADFNPDCGGIWLYRPNFFTESNLLNITRQASINIVLAAGMTFIILTGGIDLRGFDSGHHGGGGDGGLAYP